jgi:hypothetical protein
VLTPDPGRFCLDLSCRFGTSWPLVRGHSPPRVEKSGKEVLITDAEHLRDVLART